MKRIILLLFALAPLSIGCGSQEVVAPDRENFNTGEVTVHELGGKSDDLMQDESGEVEGVAPLKRKKPK